MKWNIEKSEEVKKRIAEDEGLMTELSNSIDGVLKKHGIALRNKDMSYVFEPRVFNMKMVEASEVMAKAHEAMFRDFVAWLREKGLTAEGIRREIRDMLKWGPRCLPECGIIDPTTLRVLEKIRMVSLVEPITLPGDPEPLTDSLMRQIVGDKDLLTELSESIFGILKEHDISFYEDEGCVFVPCIFETPIFAQRVSIEDKSQIRGFGPQIYAGPSAQSAIRIKPFPGIIEIRGVIRPTPGVFIDPKWWIGIPAPEMLHALQLMREVEQVRMKS
jgi:hypothetical protein